MIKLIILLVLSQGTLQSVSIRKLNFKHLATFLCVQPRRQQARHYDQDWMKYMIGEVFFKENSNQGNQHISFEDEDNEDDDTEEIPYSVLEQYDVRIIFDPNSQLLSIIKLNLLLDL